MTAHHYYLVRRSASQSHTGWWATVKTIYPELVDALDADGAALVSYELLQTLEQLAGYEVNIGVSDGTTNVRATYYPIDVERTYRCFER